VAVAAVFWLLRQALIAMATSARIAASRPRQTIHSGMPVSTPILSGRLAVSKMTTWRRAGNSGPWKKVAIMKKVLLVGAGVLITVAGAIFTLQGVGTMGGSAMSGVTFWAVAGPVIALVGLAMVIVGLRRRFAS
jgi:hypothetical protein